MMLPVPLTAATQSAAHGPPRQGSVSVGTTQPSGTENHILGRPEPGQVTETPRHGAVAAVPNAPFSLPFLSMKERKNGILESSIFLREVQAKYTIGLLGTLPHAAQHSME